MADEIVELCSHPTKSALFSLEGTGKSRTAVSAQARGNEHHLEKVPARCWSERVWMVDCTLLGIKEDSAGEWVANELLFLY